MMRKYLGVITAAILGGSMIGCSSDSGPSMSAAAYDDTAQLDKAYVPALFYSSVGKNAMYVNDALNTLGRTDAVWADFKTNYVDYKNWSDSFDAVDANVIAATAAYGDVLGAGTYPADLTAAHNELEAMRDTWSDMRTGSGVNNYFFDKVTAAHHTMETVAGASATYMGVVGPVAADALTLQNSLIATLPVYSDDWNALVSNYGNGSKVTDTYDLGTDKAAFLAANVSGAKDLIADLSAVVETCDTTSYTPVPANYASDTYNPDTANDCDTMIYLSSKIKGKFVPVFLALGDFINSFMSEIIASNRAMIPVTFCTGNPSHAKCGSGNISQIQYYMNAYLNTNGSQDPSTWTGAMMNFGAHVMPILEPLNWAEGMMAAMGAGGTAWGIIANAADLPTIQTAHPEIEKISMAMYEICAVYENQVTIMTRMGEYHGAFEAIVAIVTEADGKTPKATLTAEEVASINDAMAGLQGAFANLSDQSAKVDLAAWALSAGALDGPLAGISDSIDVLVAALATGDEATIIDATMALKAGYIPFFLVFGDFTYIP